MYMYLEIVCLVYRMYYWVVFNDRYSWGDVFCQRCDNLVF